MDRARPVPAHSSTYGQACMQCYKAKCRCVPNASGDSCERCFRLKKDCQPSGSARRRQAQKAEESDERFAQLQSQIETLRSQLQSISGSCGTSVNISGLLNGQITSPSTSDSTNIVTGSISTNSSIRGGPTPATDTSPHVPGITDLSPISLSNLSPQKAEKQLEFFLSRMLPCFPFINLGSNTRAWQLRRDRPFLFQAILTVTTFSTSKRHVLAGELKQILFTSALINVESSIDLLLGLLVYLAWSTDVFLGGADLTSRLMMIAISLVYDLRLFRPLQTDVQLVMSTAEGQPSEVGQGGGEHVAESFMEKQRAILACFILSCNISSHLGRQDALRWTHQMDEALHLIETNKKCLTDPAFACQVRLNLLKQRTAHIREQHDADRTSTTTAATATLLPGVLYLKTLREQLKDLISSFPPNIYQRDVLMIDAQYVGLYINQLAFSLSSEYMHLNISGERHDGRLLPGFERLECLWRSVESIRMWLDHFYKLPPSELPGLPFHFWSQMIVCITLLKRLSTIGDPAWDCQAVRNTVNLITAMDRMREKLDIGSREPGLQGEDNLFDLLNKLLNKSQEWAESWWHLIPQRPDAELPASPSGDPGATGDNNYGMDIDQMSWMNNMDLESDQWFEELMATTAGFTGVS